MLAAIMAIANEHDLAVLPRGLGQHLAIGNAPERADLVLSLERLDQILSHEPADMTVRVWLP